MSLCCKNTPTHGHMSMLSPHLARFRFSRARLRNSPSRGIWGHKVLGQKSCRTKFPEFFKFSARILPRSLLRIFPNFLRCFRASFLGNGDHNKFTKNPRHFSLQNSQAKSKKKSTKVVWGAGTDKKSLHGHARNCQGAIVLTAGCRGHVMQESPDKWHWH